MQEPITAGSNMSSQLSIYDPDQVSVIVNGLALDGWADGEFVKIEQNSDQFTYTSGTDGKGVRSKMLDASAKITLSFLQTSTANDFLSVLLNGDLLAHNGAGVGAFMVRDRGGRALFSGQVWVSKAPSVSFDREATVRVWELTSPRLIRFDGGS